MNTHATAYLVRQVGARNYAGPNCPGVGWNCTTSTRVLQIATTASGTNSAACTTQTCSISQSGSSNTARCSQSSSAASATQSCTINQTGATNYAFVAHRWYNLGWRLFDWSLLALALAHGLNGLRLIIDDYVRRPAKRAATKATLYTLTGILFAYGTMVIFSFPRV